MSYVESFDTEMELARLDCNALFLDRLQAAHDAEMKQLSKEEFHRGYESGVAARDAGQWQLDRERQKVVCELQKLRDRGSVWGRELVVALGLSVGATNDDFCDRLIYLLGGKSTNKGAETSAKVVKNGEKYQLDTHDALGNERHKAVCELRKLNSENFECKQFMGDLLSAIDPDWISKASMYDDATLNEYMRDRLIHLLGGDDETASNDDRTCPIAVQSQSITDELRKFVAEIWDGSIYVYQVPIRLLEIADRIDEQFSRTCSQHESVLQQTISETVDEHEREMAELRADYERATKLQRKYGEEVAELMSELDAIF